MRQPLHTTKIAFAHSISQPLAARAAPHSRTTTTTTLPGCCCRAFERHATISPPPLCSPPAAPALASDRQAASSAVADSLHWCSSPRLADRPSTPPLPRATLYHRAPWRGRRSEPWPARATPALRATPHAASVIAAAVALRNRHRTPRHPRVPRAQPSVRTARHARSCRPGHIDHRPALWLWPQSRPAAQAPRRSGLGDAGTAALGPRRGSACLWRELEPSTLWQE